MQTPKVLILMGSASDLPVMEEASRALSELGVTSELHVASAHRTPEKAGTLAREAAGRGIRVIIAGAGYAAHLAGFVAASTTLPVIGVPLEASSLAGLDALLATVQMPAGVPVATVAVGKAGARNAGILAAQMLAIADEAVGRKLVEQREQMAKKVEEADRKLRS